MYEKHFGFSRKPFSISPDPDFLYLNANYREAIALLQYAVQEQQGIVSLIGEVGTGKTMLLNLLLDSLPAGARFVKVPPIRFEFDELVSFVLEKLKTPDTAPRDKHSFDDMFDVLNSRVAAGERIILLVDEAQDLDANSLESVRLLSNFETPSRKLLQIVLVGQPELRRKLNRPELRQLKQRIAVTYEIPSLSAEEVPSYIAHRLKSAGYANGINLFTPDALQLIASASKGIPRLVNALCDNALLTGYAANKHWIDVGMVREAANDLMLDPPIDHQADLEARSPTPATMATLRAPREPRESEVRISPWRLAGVIMMLALLLVGLFAQPLLQADLSDWHQRVSALVDPSNQSADDSSPNPEPEPISETVPDQPRPEPVLSLAQPAALEVSQKAPPQPSVPDLSRAGDDRAAAAIGHADSSTPPHPAPARPPAAPQEDVPRRETSEPDASAPKAVAPIINTPAPQPSAPNRPRDDDSSQRQGVDQPTPWKSELLAPRKSESLAPVGLAAQDRETVSVARADSRPSREPATGASDARPSANSVADLVERLPLGGSTAGRGKVEAAKVQPTPPSEIVTMGVGDTITRIASSVYGEVGIYELAAIRIANPQISNLDVVEFGREVVIPDLGSGLMLSTEADGGARVLLGATQSLAAAEALRAAFERNGVSAEIVPDKLTDTIIAYRLEIRFRPDGPPTAETVDQLSTLRLQLADYRE